MKLVFVVWLGLVLVRADQLEEGRGAERSRRSSLTCRYKKGEWSECNTLLMVNITLGFYTVNFPSSS